MITKMTIILIFKGYFSNFIYKKVCFSKNLNDSVFFKLKSFISVFFQMFPFNYW